MNIFIVHLFGHVLGSKKFIVMITLIKMSTSVVDLPLKKSFVC